MTCNVGVWIDTPCSPHVLHAFPMFLACFSHVPPHSPCFPNVSPVFPRYSPRVPLMFPPCSYETAKTANLSDFQFQNVHLIDYVRRYYFHTVLHMNHDTQVIFKGLLHYPTCRVQLEVSAWSEVGRTRDLPQMTYLEVGKSGSQEVGLT